MHSCELAILHVLNQVSSTEALFIFGTRTDTVLLQMHTGTEHFKNVLDHMTRIYIARKALHKRELPHRHVIQAGKYLARLMLEHHTILKATEDVNMYGIGAELASQCLQDQLASLGHEDDYYTELCQLRDACEVKQTATRGGSSGKGTTLDDFLTIK